VSDSLQSAQRGLEKHRKE